MTNENEVPKEARSGGSVLNYGLGDVATMKENYRLAWQDWFYCPPDNLEALKVAELRLKKAKELLTYAA
jgi:hypothetical protein